MASIAQFMDKAFEDKEFHELVDQPGDALEGISPAGAEALQKVLRVKTIGDLAENKYVLRAQAIANLAKTSKH